MMLICGPDTANYLSQVSVALSPGPFFFIIDYFLNNQNILREIWKFKFIFIIFELQHYPKLKSTVSKF